MKTVRLLSARGESLPWKGTLLTVNEVRSCSWSQEKTIPFQNNLIRREDC